MANILDDLASKLQTAGAGTVGTSIFKASMPDSPDSCVCLYETGGYPPELKSSVDYPTFQVMVRNTDYATGRALAKTIQSALHGVTETTLTSGYYHLIQAIQAPSCLGQDDKQRWEWSQNYKIILRR